MMEGPSLYFKGRHMIAKSDGVTVELETLPAIDALPKNTTEIHFYTERCEYKLRENAKPQMRDMQPPEIEAVLRFLRKVSAFGCGLFRRHT